MSAFATLQEAWGVRTFGMPEPAGAAGPSYVPAAAGSPKSRAAAPLALPPAPSLAGRAYREEVRRYLLRVFKTEGAKGVRGLLPRGFLALAPAAAGRGPPDLLVVLLAAAALLVLLDSP